MIFFKKNKMKIAFSIVLLLTIMSISVTASGRVRITAAESVAGNVLSSVSGVFLEAKYAIANGKTSIGEFLKAKEQNQALVQENAKLKQEILKYQQVISKSDFLKSQHSVQSDSKYEVVSAKVTAKDPGNWFEKFTINKGSNEGVKKGDSVILGVKTEEEVVVEALVGTVAEVGDHWSKVTSIVDIGNNISFNVVNSGDMGVVKGSLNGELKGYMFDTDSKVAKGDELVTSGIGGVYQAGIYIGRVVEVQNKSESLLTQIRVEPKLNFNKIQEVFVITGEKE